MVTVASLLQIMNEINLLDLSRDLQLICIEDFINKFYLIFVNNKIFFDVRKRKFF